MSNRFRPAWLLVLAALSTSALAKAPEKTGYCRTLGRSPRRTANAGGAERR